MFDSTQAPDPMYSSPRINGSPPWRGLGPERPVVVYIVSWQDARLDLAVAGDLHSRLGTEFDSHLVQLYDPDVAPMAERGAYQFERNDSELTSHIDALFRTLQPDVVHTHTIRDLEAILPAASKAGVPHLVHRVESPATAGTAPYSLGDGEFLQHAGVQVVLPCASLLPTGWTGAPPRVIPPGIDCTRFTSGDAEPARRKVGLPLGPKILGCGSPSEYLDPLIQATVRTEPDIHLALFGPATPTPRQRQRIRRLGLDERVHVLGPWAEPELIYRAVDAYFHGPDPCPLPRQVLAAQAVGKLVVATRPVLAESLCPANVHRLPTLFVPALTKAIQRVVSGSPADSIRPFIETRWNADRMIASYREMFRTLIAESDDDSASSPGRPDDRATRARS